MLCPHFFSKFTGTCDSGFICFLSDVLEVLTVHSNSIPALSVVRPKFADFFRRVTSRHILSGCLSLRRTLKISRPLDVALTICQSGQIWNVSAFPRVFHSAENQLCWREEKKKNQ